MAVRSGSEFIDGLRRNPREVWAGGRRIDDVTDRSGVFPAGARDRLALRPAGRARASRRHDPSRTRTASVFGTSFLIAAQPRRSGQAPAVDEGLGRRQLRHARPLAGFSQHRADGLGRERRLLRPARRAVRRQRPQLLQVLPRARPVRTPTPSSIRRPTAPRARTSRPTSSPISAWSRRTKDGLIVRGAKMLATHGPTADEILVYPQPGIREGEERYVLAFGIPCATKGLKFICREPFDDGTQIALGPSARRALRGAGRGLRVRRRADPVGPRFPLRRREDGQCVVCARPASATTPATRPRCAGSPNASSWSAS